MAASPSGFALRVNGTSCLNHEVDCGQTVAPYHVCCPAGSFCPTQYNVDCCPTPANCTASLVQNPRCANETWDLYDNGGYFCCLKGLFGYAARVTNSNGCGSEGYILKSGEVMLPLVRAGEDPSTTSSPSSSSSSASTATSSSPPPSATPPLPSQESPSLPTGTKAGIGIGVTIGVIALALLAWAAFARHKRRRLKGSEKNSPPVVPQELHVVAGPSPEVKSAGYQRYELDGRQMPVEVAGENNHAVELEARR
ncbi:hypothetical protein B0T14DRAFT_492125 [Immersiella caudata]|uniref:Uncharacterized protein n=1 Tax=Immersiella caudata TaxID=314043 RepID=A0AA40CE48_9PEZI|nr:hypothetical protein B0T14DRAFT_492125 [Immersiella caudata]